MVAAVTPPSRARPTTTSSTSRSVRSLATASSSGTRPLSGTSALAVATMRPGTRGTAGGTKTSVSTPTGTTVSRSAATRKSRRMSSSEERETVSTAGSARSTRPCIRRKEYQRCFDSRSTTVRAAARSWRRSTVIGWWQVAMTWWPAACRASSP